MLSFSEKIRVILKRKNLTIRDLANLLNISSQNLSKKLSRNNFSEKDIKQITEALGCDYEIKIKIKDTGEEI